MSHARGSVLDSSIRSFFVEKLAVKSVGKVGPSPVECSWATHSVWFVRVILSTVFLFLLLKMLLCQGSLSGVDGIMKVDSGVIIKCDFHPFTYSHNNNNVVIGRRNFMNIYDRDSSMVSSSKVEPGVSSENLTTEIISKCENNNNGFNAGECVNNSRSFYTFFSVRFIIDLFTGVESAVVGFTRRGNFGGFGENNGVIQSGENNYQNYFVPSSNILSSVSYTLFNAFESLIGFWKERVQNDYLIRLNEFIIYFSCMFLCVSSRYWERALI
jgi:hypothetical protein